MVQEYEVEAEPQIPPPKLVLRTGYGMRTIIEFGVI